MRAVIQRVSKASVEINGNIYGQINKGLLILLGIEELDSEVDVEWLSNKIVSLRIFNDDDGKMNLSLKDIQGEILLISQFTLHASIAKGQRPSFIKAAKPPISKPLYEMFARKLEELIQKPIKTGIFGADMKVHLVNDGPVTIIMDSKNKND
ncbi:MAG: D-tyrosyl-tRNA(Tyr) deacylase [Chitinophagales bacterium]|nr:D-tyrosyl-tRNA(Tyr) deacylase [Chitinophagales bacterium]